MSAILSTPTLPTLLRLDDIKAYIDSEIEKGIEKALHAAVEKVLAKSEYEEIKKRLDALKEENVRIREENLRLLRHVSILEGHLNINYADYDDFCLTGNTYEDLKDEGITPFCDQIKQFEQRTVLAPEKSKETKIDNSPIIPHTSLELKACALMVHLHENAKPNWCGDIGMSTPEFYDFMTNKISPDLRWKPDLRNPRQAKKDILEKAVKMYSNILILTKSKNGNKTTGIALNKSANRRYTDSC